MPMISFIESTVFSYSIFYCQAYTTFEEVRRGVWQRYNTDSLSRARDFFSSGRSPWVFFRCFCNCLTAVFHSTTVPSTWNIRAIECYRSWTSGLPPDPSRSLLACRSQAEAESALRSLPSFAFCSTEAESVMRSLPSLALARREQRVLDLSEP